MQRGEVYLANFPFGDTAAMKLRPVLLLTGTVDTGTEVLVAYISSVVPSTPLSSDIVLDPAQTQHQSTRLKTKSVLRLHKLATIHASSLQRRLGKITGTTQQNVDAKLRVLLNL